MNLKVVNDGRSLVLVDKKGRKIAPLPWHLSSSDGMALIKDHLRTSPYPADPHARKAWAETAFSKKRTE